MWRVLIYVFFTLYLLHLLMALCQAFGIIKFTDKKITLLGILTPCYYWFNLGTKKNETSEKPEETENSQPNK